MIVALQTTTFSAHGGIPTYNRVVSRALNEFADSSETHLLVANDGVDQPQAHDYSNLKFHGFAGNRSSFVSKILRLTLTRRIELMLIGHVNYAPLGWIMKRLQPSMRYGVMVHGIDVWSRLSWNKRLALQKADFVTSVSEFTKRKAISVNDVSEGKIYVLPNALEWTDERRMALAPPALPRSGARLLSVCRLSQDERYKGVDTTIEALPSVIRAVPDLQYYVIGSGTDVERHKELAIRCGVARRVHFLGAVDSTTLREQYEACDVFVMPSAGEGFGIVFLEAMSYAKPIVAANCGAVPEVIKDGTSGTLIEYGNREHLAQALIRMCRDRGKQEEMGQAGHQYLYDNFTFDHFRQRLSKILLRELHIESPPRAKASVQGTSGTPSFTSQKATRF